MVTPVKTDTGGVISDNEVVSKNHSGGVKNDNKGVSLATHTIETKEITKDIKDNLEEPMGDHQDVIKYWTDKYEQFYGTKYRFQRAKDGALVKGLLKDFSLDQVRALVDQIFVSTDDFYETGGGRTIGVLSANANKLVQEIKRGQNPLANLPKRTQDNIKNAASYLAKQKAKDGTDIRKQGLGGKKSTQGVRALSDNSD